ncbi:hypothetical protein GOB93_16565 [Acetobacter musti]|uniref:Transposase n=1 Tax=Acetobacter musti TaxID=864732 RepID=A0ABX0JTT9_9PROT|nr:hypothetical protein [Acetobacter musti]
MIAQLKRQAIEGMSGIFSGGQAPETGASPADVEKLHAKIGQLLVEWNFLQDVFARLRVIRGCK